MEYREFIKSKISISSFFGFDIPVFFNEESLLEWARGQK